MKFDDPDDQQRKEQGTDAGDSGQIPLAAHVTHLRNVGFLNESNPGRRLQLDAECLHFAADSIRDRSDLIDFRFHQLQLERRRADVLDHFGVLVELLRHQLFLPLEQIEPRSGRALFLVRVLPECLLERCDFLAVLKQRGVIVVDDLLFVARDQLLEVPDPADGQHASRFLLGHLLSRSRPVERAARCEGDTVETASRRVTNLFLHQLEADSSVLALQQ